MTNKTWAKDFKEEAKKIKVLLGKNCVGIHHIGDTSVKNMKAEPSIDIMPIVKDLSKVKELLNKFDELDYQYKGEDVPEGRLYFEKVLGENLKYQLHFYEDKDKNETSRHLALREYLKNYPEEAKMYSEGKKDAGYLDELEKKAVVWAEQQMQQSNSISLGMCLGMSIGTAVGAAMGNISIGMCMGISVGLAIGVALGAAKKDKK